MNDIALRSIASLAPLALALCAVPATAHAAEFTVNSTSDQHDISPGDGICRVWGRLPTCTLRAAIEEANALAGTDVIRLGAGHYTLTQGELEASSSLTIQGTDDPVIDANGASRVLHVDGDGAAINVRLYDLTVTGGSEWYPGGCIDVWPSSRLHVMRSVVEGCSSTQMGSGIASWGYVRIYRSSIRDNGNIGSQDGGGVTATGGGIFSAYTGTLDIESSAIVGNHAPRGGGIASAGALTVSDSTISGNTSLSYGAGVLVLQADASTADIDRCTITENEVGYSDNEGTTGGAGIMAFDYVRIHATILAGNVHTWHPLDEPDAPDCRVGGVGVIESAGYNFIGDATPCGIDLDDSDMAGDDDDVLDPELGPLVAWTSGGTEVHIPQSGSPVIHAGPRCQISSIPNTPIPNCYLVDQRGYSRANGDSIYIDIGAYETDGYLRRYIPGPLF